MKKILIILIVTISSCRNNSNIEINTFLQELNNNNLDYFRTQMPKFYFKIPDYVILYEVDSLSNLLVDNINKGDDHKTILKDYINKTKSILNIYKKQTRYNPEILNHINDNDRKVNTILEIEYICGNILIEKYNEKFFKIRAVAAIAKYEAKISLGDTLRAMIYLSGIDPNNKFTAIIDNDTLPYFEGYVPYFELVPKKKGVINKTGRLLIKSPLNNGFSNQEFSINCTVN